MGGNRVNDKITRGIPSSGCKTDYREDGAVYVELRVGVPPGV